MRKKDLFCGIDLHSNNSYLAISDANDRRIFHGRFRNDLELILTALEPCRERIVAVAVESTFNWYWLVDGLMTAGYDVKLVNTSAVRQYEGLKHTDDRHDAFWLAHLMRLGILPTGHILEPGVRALRDVLRKRMRLVQQRSANITSIENLQQRNEGARMTADEIKAHTAESIAASVSDPNRALALRSTQEVIMTLNEQIRILDTAAQAQLKPSPDWKRLQTVWGVGRILASVIQLETGPITRFPDVGDYASYCRCVPTGRISNNKKKGEGNEKNGNKFLCWAFVEAANFSIRSYPAANRLYQRKKAKKGPIVARKALAHKLARATYFVLRDGVEFKPELLFRS
jgi:transposase